MSERHGRGQRRLGLAVVFLAVIGLIAAGTPMAFGAADDADNPDCAVIVPPDPLSATGLATPYQLEAQNRAAGACHEATDDQSAFVQAAIFDPATSAITIYNPLVIDKGTQPAAAPVTPVVPAGAVVALWFGFNGDTLKLADNNGSFAAGKCVNGLGTSLFGQYSYCNAPAFFDAANAAIDAGKLKVPWIGVANDGQPCLTTRDFTLIDQDQSDNDTTTYIVLPNGTTAQDTAANETSLTTGTVIGNGSDNRLLDAFMDPAMGCTPWTEPDAANPGHMVTALPLNELQAASKQQDPVAMVPLNDPMTTITNGDNTVYSTEKTNLYRAGVDMAPVGSNPEDLSPKDYCDYMMHIAPARLMLNKTALTAGPTADPAVGDNLWDFMAGRLQASYENLGCKALGVTDTVALRTNSDGVATGVTYKLN